MDSGLPPRGRGRRGDSHERGGEEGATPARAGTTGYRTRPGLISAGYPRAGGDDSLAPAPLVAQDGLPPRGRGRPSSVPITRYPRRATPARAGTTRPRWSWCSGTRGYPRAGGDDSEQEPDYPEHAGLPPRGRGRRDLLGSQARTRPRAGTTPPGASVAPRRRGYPRAGGDDLLAETLDGTDPGLPPRGRGRPTVVDAEWVPPRATPARAGTTRGCRRCRRRHRGYPRAGGDDAC